MFWRGSRQEAFSAVGDVVVLFFDGLFVGTLGGYSVSFQEDGDRNTGGKGKV